MLLLEQYQNSKNACDRVVRFQKAWEATLSEHSNGAVYKLPEHVRDPKLVVKQNVLLRVPQMLAATIKVLEGGYPNREAIERRNERVGVYDVVNRPY